MAYQQRQGAQGGVISPDLETFFGNYGTPQVSQPLPTDESEIARILKEIQGSGQGNVLNELVRTGMTKGLGTTDKGQLNFSQQGMGAQGYNGALRPSDVPGQQVAPMLRPEDAYAVDAVNRIRRTKFESGELGDMMDLLGAIPKHINSREVEAGVLNSKFPNMAKSLREPVRLTLAERAAQELANRKANPNGPRDPILGGLEPDELKVMMGIESKPKAASDTPKVPNSNDKKFLTDTYNSAYEATKGSPDMKRRAGMAAARAEAARKGWDVTLDESIFGDTVKPIAKTPGSQVGGSGQLGGTAAAGGVVVRRIK